MNKHHHFSFARIVWLAAVSCSVVLAPLLFNTPAAASTVTKTYTNSSNVILDVSAAGGGSSSSNVGQDFTSFYQPDQLNGLYGGCSVWGDQQLYCRLLYGANDYPTKFELPSGVTVKQVGYKSDTVLCVLGSNNLLYCVGYYDTGFGGSYSRNLLGTGSSSGTTYYPDGSVAAPFSTSAGNPVMVKTIFGSGGPNSGMVGGDGNICVQSLDDNYYCAGENVDGFFGIGNANSKSWATRAFTQAPYFNDPNIKIQSIVSARPIGLGLYFLSSNSYVQTGGPCVTAGTNATDTQLYCAGYCGGTAQAGRYAILGTALRGSGQKGCGTFPGPGTPAPNNGNSYYRPVKFVLPASAGSVLGASYIIQGSNNIALCVKASDNHTYCTGDVIKNPSTDTYGFRKLAIEPIDLESQ